MKIKQKLTCMGTAVALMLAFLMSMLPISAVADEAEPDMSAQTAPLYQITDGKAMIDGKEYLAIYNAEELGKMELNKNYILANDIDCSGVAAKTGGYLFDFPGKNDNNSAEYTVLNGNGYALTGIDFTSDAGTVGVFNGGDKKGGKANGGMTVRDLNIGTADAPARITSTAAAGEVYVGGLAARINASATVERVNVYAEISVVDAYAGGLLGTTKWGDNAGHAVTLTDCSFQGKITSSTVSGTRASGGMIGGQLASAISLTVTGCVNNGTFSGATAYGGMIGTSSSGANVTLTDCINHADLATVDHNWGSKLGGMIGQISEGTTATEYLLTGCINNGTLTAPGKNAGGMLGEFTSFCKAVTMENCRNYGAVIGSNERDGSYGGMLGLYYPQNDQSKLTLSKCVNEGAVSGPVNVGGLFGCLQKTANVEVSQCANMGNVSATTGTAAGLGNTHSVEGLISDAEMNVDGFLNAGVISSVSGSAGGVLGMIKASGFAKLTNLANLGTVSAGEDKTAANFVAEFDGLIILPTADASYGGAAGLSDSSDMTLEEALIFLNSGSIGKKIGKFELNEAKDQLTSTLSALDGEMEPDPVEPTPANPTPTTPVEPTPSNPTPTEPETPTQPVTEDSATDEVTDENKSSGKGGCSSMISFSCLTAVLLIGAGGALILRKKEN